jgi:hypothetical protein
MINWTTKIPKNIGVYHMENIRDIQLRNYDTHESHIIENARRLTHNEIQELILQFSEGGLSALLKTIKLIKARKSPLFQVINQ